jgi:lipid-binding SYLF domain-containing protein
MPYGLNLGEKTMKMSTLVLLAVCAVVVISGCSNPQGDTAAEKRDYAEKMRKDTIAELYSEKPIAKEQIKNAAGYAVFSNMNINLFLLSSGNGYGIARDNKTGDDIYMKMRFFGVGLGLGAKDFRAVIIFKTDEAMKQFTESGWEWGGHADAAAKSGEKGAEASAAAEIGDMIVYNFTEAGIALQATVQGTKYWVDDELN